VISVVFTVILMGLGIDFGVHLAANFELVRHRFGKGVGGMMAAMRESIETVGPGNERGRLGGRRACVAGAVERERGLAAGHREIDAR